MIVSVPFAFQVRSLQGLVKLETELARRTGCGSQVKQPKSEKLSPFSSSEEDTRSVRVAFSRARFFLCPLLPSYLLRAPY